MSSNDSGVEGQVEHKAFKALPRDPNQPEHKKPRVFIHRPDEDEEQAAESRRNATYFQAAKTIKLEDFSTVHQKPCVRDGFLPGIAGGMAIGAGRFVIGGSIMAACNWASGSFVGLSLVAYQYCQRQRKLEKDGIRKAVKVLDQKAVMKEAKEKAKLEEEAAAAADKRGTPFWSSFKFW